MLLPQNNYYFGASRDTAMLCPYSNRFNWYFVARKTGKITPRYRSFTGIKKKKFKRSEM